MAGISIFLLSSALMNSFSLSTYAEVSNQYVYRGNNLRKDTLAPQLGFSLQHDSGWFVDTWGVRTEQKSRKQYSNDSDIDWEVDISAGYQHHLGTDWRWALSHAWVKSYHDLPDTNLDYREWRGNLFYLNTVSVLLAYSDNYQHTNYESWTGEIDLAYALHPAWFGLAGVGQFEIGDTDPIQYGWLGIQRDFRFHPLTDFANWKVRLHYSDSDYPPDYVNLCEKGCLEFSFALAW